MEKKSVKELEQLLENLRREELSPREIYHAVQSFGENNFLKARVEVEKLLKSDHPDLRFVSLKVLTQYWHLVEHWETAKDMLEYDIDEECRFRAASALGALMRNTQDRKTLKILSNVVANDQEVDIVREAAYAAILAVLYYGPTEQFKLAAKGIDLKKGIDWDMLQKYL